MKKENKKISKPLVFMLSVLGLYAILFVFNKYLIMEAFINTIILFFKLLPILLLVFIISVATNYYLKGDKVKKHLGHESGIKGWVYAMISGILISGPPYILYPLLGDLKKSGMKDSLLAVFLYNRNVKIPFIPVMIYYFGLAFTVIMSIYIVIFSVFNGLVIGRITKK
ncbi:permease [Candidatus Falkowbacteria bacterium]|nr:MAG: permease [Candidatus Falkowbacteria bacterium]